MALSRVCAAGVIAAIVLLGPGLSRPGIAAGGAVQVFVQPGASTAPVLSLIRSARHTIRLEVYLLTSRTIVDALAQAKHRGVNVRVLLEEHPFGGSRYAQLGYSDLSQAGVPVRWANEGAFTYTHEKAMTVDGTTAGIFTFNLTSSGLFRNREFGVIDHNGADARTIATIFDADWSRRTPRVSDSTLVISPTTSRRQFDTIIDGARHTLDLYAEEVDDSSIEGHLARAVRRHVRVRLITSTTSAGVNTIRSAGVKVRIMSSPYVHAKAIIADGARLFIGSENISTTSLDRNREMGIVLRSKPLAGVVESTFNGDWSGSAPSSTPPPPPTSRSSGNLRVRVSASPATVKRGQELTISASTEPGATCSIRVTYPDGYVSRASSLSRREVAGGDGSVSWSWHVGSTVTGTSAANVTCSLGGHTASGGTTFSIAG